VPKVVSSNPVHCEVSWIQHYVIKFVSDLRQVSSRVIYGKVVYNVEKSELSMELNLQSKEVLHHNFHTPKIGLVMVFNATFNNISFIWWRSVLLVEETGENHRSVASH
jgi:hypothetical protein